MHKRDLITCLKNNLVAHRETFLKANEGYRKRVVEELETMLADARQGLNIKGTLSYPEPEDHSEDYKRSIHLLEMCLDEKVQVTDEDVQRLVMDEWEWKNRWKAINTNYIY